ncbi:hypothetical protein AYO21_10489 [Fonsecaea monophora]|uniref:Oxidase FUB9 n=1 Tax=Fonsecaea monophora TaxID=254056 RepID=A0A177EWM4_9EURO|nr:hypothetical protein AYO21_10489 [Fonsecaea monophora]OAG35349.1 hypothetical protein AYO21_10489 [Fonsecaea monophora]
MAFSTTSTLVRPPTDVPDMASAAKISTADHPVEGYLDSIVIEPRRPDDLGTVLTINDLRELAQKKVPKILRDNEAAYNRYKIRPRVLVDVSELDSSIEMFGKKLPIPLGFAPAAAHKLAHPDGELATSRAAAKAGIPMGLSSYSTTSIEDVAREGGGNPYLMHLTIMKDRSRTVQTLRRIEKAGFRGIFLTVDTAVLGRRLNEYRNNFQMPPGVSFPNMKFEASDAEKEGTVNKGARGFKSVVKTEKDTKQDWETVIPWLKSQTKLQIWAKGIYTPEDVRMAIKYGLDGVVISNHGGRQLDGVPASLDALRDCAPAALDPNGKRLIQIALDGGIRKGTDIFKAIALGAQMVFIGRIPIWGLSVGGEEGVTKAVEILAQEFRQTMALAGNNISRSDGLRYLPPPQGPMQLQGTSALCSVREGRYFLQASASGHNSTGREHEQGFPPTRHGRSEEHGESELVSQAGSMTSPSTSDIIRSVEDGHLSRSALPTFYRTEINNTLPATPQSRWAYVGTTVSNLAHLVNARTTRPDCLHYPFPHYRSTLPWKPSASSSTTRAIPVIQPQESSSAHEPPHWTFTTLPDPDLGILPVSEIRVELIDAYFKYIHPGYPVVQEADFRRRLKASTGKGGDTDGGTALTQEPPALLLIQCVLLAGAHVSTHPTVQNARSSIKEALYRRVRTLFDMRYENDRLLLLQAALILTWHVDSGDDVSANAWYWSGIASRIALGLGLHRRFASMTMRRRGQRRMRTMWWMVVQTEILCALNHGRPVSFDLDDCDQTLLTEDDLHEEEVDPDTGALRAVCTANVDFCLANTSLCVLIWEMLKLHSPGVKRRLGGEGSMGMRAAKMDLNARLAAWCMQLPPSMGQPGMPAQDTFAAQLHLHYYMAIIALNRRTKTEPMGLDPGYGLTSDSPGVAWAQQASVPGEGAAQASTQMPRDDIESQQCSSLCHTSAVSIVSILTHMTDMGWIKSCWLSTMTSILAAAVHFSYEIRSATLGERNANGETNTDPPLSVTRQSLSPFPSTQGSPFSLLVALGSLDRLQMLVTISTTLIPYWSSAEGLSQLLETISAELKGMITFVTGRKDRKDTNAADRNTAKRTSDAVVEQTSNPSFTVSAGTYQTSDPKGQVHHRQSTAPLSQQADVPEQSRKSQRTSYMSTPGTATRKEESLDSDALRRHSTYATARQGDSDYADSSVYTHISRKNTAGTRETASSDQAPDIWEPLPGNRTTQPQASNPGAALTFDDDARDPPYSTSDTLHGDSGRGANNVGSRNTIPFPPRSAQSSAFSSAPVGAETRGRSVDFSSGHAAQSFPTSGYSGYNVAQAMQPPSRKVDTVAASAAGGNWELQIDDLLRYMTDPGAMTDAASAHAYNAANMRERHGDANMGEYMGPYQ